MFKILKSLTFKDLPTKPEITGQPALSEDMQQTVALLSAWDGITRRLIRSSQTGILYASSPKVKSIINKVSTGSTENVTFTDIPISEVLVMANANNGGHIWLNIGANGGVDIGWPLDAGDSLNISLNNLLDLHLHIITSGDKAIIIYTI